MYLFDNELFAIECVAKYAMEGRVVDSRNGHFAHCPTPRPKGQKKRLPGDLGYYLTFEDHQKQGLLQSVDVGRMCYFKGDTKEYLDTKPPGYEELYEIYDKFNKHTEEHKASISKALRGKYGGEKAPNYGKFGAAHNNSKAIIAIKPDGTKLHFGSILEAARELPINCGTLSGRYLKPGKQPKGGKFEGWQFFYAVKSNKKARD